MAAFLVALAEFDEKRQWEDLGYQGLYGFLKKDLGLSNGAAFYRKTAAQLIRRFPEIVEPLRDGRLCLMTVGELAKVLTPENRVEVLPRFFGRSRREAAALAAEVVPVENPPLREVIRALPSAPTASLFAPASPEPDRAISLPVGNSPKPIQPTVTTRFDKLSEVDPLTAALRRLHLTVTARFLEKLERARDGMSNAHPDARTAEILEAALDLLLKQQARARGLVEKPRKRRKASEDPAYIPAEVKREVWARDRGCCQWPNDGGGICGSRRRLQYDHKIPRALGGLPTVENTRLLCLFHNQLAARLVFGDAWMEQWKKRPAVAREPEASYGAPYALAAGGSSSARTSLERRMHSLQM